MVDKEEEGQAMVQEQVLPALALLVLVVLSPFLYDAFASLTHMP